MGCVTSSYDENTDDYTDISNSFFSLYCEKGPSKFVSYEIIKLAYLQHLYSHGISLSDQDLSRIFIKMLQEQEALLFGYGGTVVVGIHLHSWVKR
jgi:hypothetical protein